MVAFNRLKFVIFAFSLGSLTFFFSFFSVSLSPFLSLSLQYTSWKHKDIYREARDRRARSLGYFRFID